MYLHMIALFCPTLSLNLARVIGLSFNRDEPNKKEAKMTKLNEHTDDLKSKIP